MSKENKYIKKGIRLFFLGTLLSTSLFAQSKEIKGKVTDEKGNPIYGVSVSSSNAFIKGDITKRDGTFTLKAELGDKLHLKSIDNRVKDVFVQDSILDISLNSWDYVKPAGRDIEQKNTDLVSAVSIINEANFHANPIDASNALYGKLPGLQVLQTQGNAWNDGAKLYIRGMGTTNSKSPLILVDGIERSFDNLTAQEIESVSILKDGPALTLYGLKGSNGVVLITTKRGAEMKPEITLNYEFNMGRPYKTPKFVNGLTYANALNEGLVNDGRDPRYNSRELEAYRTGEYPDFYPDVDWWEESLRKFSFGDNVNFTLRGGGKVAKYFTQLNFVDDRGILGPTRDSDGNKTQFKYSKLNIRTNLDIQLAPKTDLKINLLGNISEHNRPGFTSEDIFKSLYNVPSGVFPIKNKNGIWAGTKDYSNNPIAMISGSGYARSQGRTLYADMTLRQDFSNLVKGLSAQATVGLDHSATYWDSNTRNFAYEEAIMNWDNPEESKYVKLREESPLDFSTSTGTIRKFFTVKGNVNYDRTFGKHDLSAKVGFSMDKETNKGRNNTFAYVDLYTYLHYMYNNRYALDFSFSAAANSTLDPDHKWGTFPAIGAAWVLSEENFLKDVKWINLLKLRSTYGITGLASYPVNLYKDRFGGGNGYFFKDGLNSFGGTAETQLAVSGFTYEKSHKVNLGLDFVAFNKLSVALDIFHDRRTDILVESGGLISGVLGIKAPYINNGEVKNKGYELAVNWADTYKDFSYSIGGNISQTKSKVINMNEVYRPHSYLEHTGKPLGQMFGYEVIGIYQNQEDIDNRDVKQYLSEVRPGDLMFKDQNGDGRIDEYDMVAMGYNTNCPEIYYGFNLSAEYKGFGFYANFQGVEHFSKWLNTPSLYRPLVNNNTTSSEYYNNRWTPETPNAKYPRLTVEGSKNNYSNNSLWLADASFLKLRTLEIYYNLPTKWISKTALKTAKIYARGHDLLRFSKMKIQDPEGMSTQHPLMKQVVMGINVSF